MSEKKYGSPRFKFNVEDLMGVLKTALMVALAAFLTFLVQSLGNIEMGEGVLIFIPAVTAVLNGLINWVKDNTPKTEDV